MEQHHRKVGTIEGAHDGVHAVFLLDTHGEHEEVALGAVRVVRGVTPQAAGSEVGGPGSDSRRQRVLRFAPQRVAVRAELVRVARLPRRQTGGRGGARLEVVDDTPEALLGALRL